MNLNDSYKAYSAYLGKYKIEIIDGLSVLFYDRYLSRIKQTLKQCDYGGFIGIPLFIVWLIWANSFETTSEQILPAIVIIVLGVVIHSFAKHIIILVFADCFERFEYREYLISFVNRTRQEDVSKAVTQAQREELFEIYNYIQREILIERLRYRKK